MSFGSTFSNVLYLFIVNVDNPLTTATTSSSSSSHQKTIKNREKGITTIHKHQTRIVEDPNQIIKEISRLTANSNELSTCISSGGLEFSYKYFLR
jgi:hypothetical protein